MKYDIVLAGVGGQGVLSVAAVIAEAALREGLSVRQSEVHGMSQRGGEVVANLRLHTGPVPSDLVPIGGASLILSLEPLESLRYLRYLSRSGVVVTSVNPVRNIAAYPALPRVLEAIASLPQAVLIDAEGLARRSGSVRAANMALAGAAARLLPVSSRVLEQCVSERFASKGPALLAANVEAFRAGWSAAA